MARATKQTTENCMELKGFVGMFAIDAETEADKFTLASTLLVEVIEAYKRAGLSLDEINEVLSCAVETYKKKTKGKS